MVGIEVEGIDKKCFLGFGTDSCKYLRLLASKKQTILRYQPWPRLAGQSVWPPALPLQLQSELEQTG
jgi:hypothetical protein